MRISDWSSDVCSSDLTVERKRARPYAPSQCEAAFEIASEDRAVKAEVGIVRHPYRLLLFVEGEDHVNRAEDLLLDNRRRILDIGQYGGCEERSEEHTSELQSLMRISYAVFCLKKKTNIRQK